MVNIYKVQYQLPDSAPEWQGITGIDEDDAIEKLKSTLRQFCRDEECMEHDEAFEYVEGLQILELNQIKI